LHGRSFLHEQIPLRSSNVDGGLFFADLGSPGFKFALLGLNLLGKNVCLVFEAVADLFQLGLLLDEFLFEICDLGPIRVELRNVVFVRSGCFASGMAVLQVSAQVPLPKVWSSEGRRAHLGDGLLELLDLLPQMLLFLRQPNFLLFKLLAVLDELIGKLFDFLKSGELLGILFLQSFDFSQVVRVGFLLLCQARSKRFLPQVS
jgi:hypothetical protein